MFVVERAVRVAKGVLAKGVLASRGRVSHPKQRVESLVRVKLVRDLKQTRIVHQPSLTRDRQQRQRILRGHLRRLPLLRARVVRECYYYGIAT